MSGIFLPFLSHNAYSQFHDVKILRFDSREDLNKFGEIRRLDNKNGLSISPLSRIDVDQNPNGEKLLSERAGNFRLNQFVVVCFTSTKSIVMRMVDTTPMGKTQKIFPFEKSFARIDANTEYCLGGPESEATLRMGEKSGAGHGLLHLIGAPDEKSLPPIDTGSLPRIDAEKNGEASRDNFFEAWFKYTVD